ncbi:hypothetical protein QQ73_10040, partial [Candidatus Endoriftia persephone str. Guaymas]|nr:hypothetical protein [Candidatus Endoriftia persephone str. Guaymas]
MELRNINQIENATQPGRPELFRLGTALVFIVAVMLYSGITTGDLPGGLMLIAAAMIGGYMAM